MIAALLLCLAASSQAKTVRSVDQVFKDIDRLELAQVNADANGVRAVDRKIEALAPEVVRSGFAAVGPLAAIIRDQKRSEKTRLWAVNFLALTRDPAALGVLKGLLDDPKQPPLLRAAAPSALSGLTLSAKIRRQALCDSIARELPDDALRETLYALSSLGCDDAAALERRAKENSGKPDAAYAIRALGRSFPVESARALWRLFDFFPRGSVQRLEILRQLLAQRDNLRIIGPLARRYAEDALKAETDHPDNAVAAARLLASLDDPAAASALRRFLKNKDAEVVAECAEGLARLKDKGSAKDLKNILDHIDSDARFAVLSGRPDPKENIARIEKSLAALSKVP